ncbi:MAG TPA: efflux RND transporter periplasmic adaptor subunit, partial [Acetobacteraceae bacterium]|nr:efflux RND transporter periplasmic adaptor subunit [Acetobacteraceae bacterium]
PPPPPLAPVPVTVAAAETGDVPIYLSGIGTVQAYNTVQVKSRVDGQIAKVLFTEGQDVKIGDPLLIIDPRPYQALLEQAKAAKLKDQAVLDGALQDLARYADLAPRKFISAQQLADEHATVEAARAQIANDTAQIAYAQTQVDYTTIRSPIDGRVGIRQVDIGNIVHATDTNPLVTVTQLRPISVIFTLPAVMVAQSRLKPGEVHVPVLVYAEDDKTLLDRGSVEMVDNTVDPTTGTIKLKADFPNTRLTLWPGNFVNGKIVVKTEHDAVTVPVAALRHGPRGDFVWLLRPDDTVVTRGVTAGEVDDGRVLIARGLRRGDEVVTEGNFRLDQHAKVAVARESSTPRPGTTPRADTASTDD